MEFLCYALPTIVLVAAVVLIRFKWSTAKVVGVGSLICTLLAVLGKFQEIKSWQTSADPIERILYEHADIPAELLGTAVFGFAIYVVLWAIIAATITFAYRWFKKRRGEEADAQAMLREGTAMGGEEVKVSRERPPEPAAESLARRRRKRRFLLGAARHSEV